MRTTFVPELVNGPFGDPGLYIDLRDERRALLIDIGDITALPPRKLLRISHVFVSHAHMDHFLGFDHLLRIVLGRKRQIVLFGGPAFIRQIEHKLAAYAWNVVHRYETELVFVVREVALDGQRGCWAKFSSANRFKREDWGEWTYEEDVILDEPGLRVRAQFVDHGIPVLAFAVEEKAHVNIWKNRVAELGMTTGPWLRSLKQAILRGDPEETPIEAHWIDRHGSHRAVHALGELKAQIVEMVPGRRIGYVTDLRFTEPNLLALEALLAGCDTLYIEAVFLHEDAEHAARKNHLTARQAGAIARRLQARTVVPFHYSPRYSDRPLAIPQELQWSRDRIS